MCLCSNWVSWHGDVLWGFHERKDEDQGLAPDNFWLAGEFGSWIRHDVHSYRQQNGFLPCRMRGEVCSFGTQVLPGQARTTAFNVGCGEGAGKHSPNDARNQPRLVSIWIQLFWWINSLIFAGLCKQGSSFVFKYVGEWSSQWFHSHHNTSLTSWNF